MISITSVNQGEGKSTTSTNIAWAFARAGYKTLLIDGDILNSVMLGFFKARDKITGLTEHFYQELLQAYHKGFVIPISKISLWLGLALCVTESDSSSVQ